MKKIYIVVSLLAAILCCGSVWAQYCDVNVRVYSNDVQQIGIENAQVTCGRYPQKTDKNGMTTCLAQAGGNTISVIHLDGCYSDGTATVPYECANGSIQIDIPLTYNISTGCGSRCPALTVNNVPSTITKGAVVDVQWKDLPFWHLAKITLLQDKLFLGYVKSWDDLENDGQEFITIPSGAKTGYYWFRVIINGQIAQSNRFYIP